MVLVRSAEIFWNGDAVGGRPVGERAESEEWAWCWERRARMRFVT